MAGAKQPVTVTINDDDVQKAIKKALRQTSDLSPALKAIGEHLVESTTDRFIDQQDPSGNPWEPLSVTTFKLRAKKGISDSDILVGTGLEELSKSINYQVTGNDLYVGSNKVYAAIHQFGGETGAGSWFSGAVIPARPFIGLSDDDRDEVLETLKEHLSQAF